MANREEVTPDRPQYVVAFVKHTGKTLPGTMVGPFEDEDAALDFVNVNRLERVAVHRRLVAPGSKEAEGMAL